MPKRKSIKESKEDRWRRKMKKYEEKLGRKTGRILYSSDEESDQGDPPPFPTLSVSEPELCEPRLEEGDGLRTTDAAPPPGPAARAAPTTAAPDAAAPDTAVLDAAAPDAASSTLAASTSNQNLNGRGPPPRYQQRGLRTTANRGGGTRALQHAPAPPPPRRRSQAPASAPARQAPPQAAPARRTFAQRAPRR
ncbi:uncharacterized protein isoform X2 [Choristoneura fumiferana]|uniref:uncharacterized protein isoform X2 n=1 Tax=Choristoneura fumiferana TaxID=7141 RepID=UPI003D154B67